ncbi:hypothetical protein NMY22_g11330 [Coprinellus aureogranulatus]|nr:hypothetical protein NMY22_g11330 [Coprinellus aureogranulatus]
MPVDVPSGGDIQDVEMADATGGDNSEPIRDWEKRSWSPETLKREADKMKDAERAWEQQKAGMEEKMKVLEASLAAKDSVLAALQKREEEGGAAGANVEGEASKLRMTELEEQIRALKSTLNQREAAIEALERQNTDVGNRSYEWECRYHKEKKDREKLFRYATETQDQNRSLQHGMEMLEREFGQTKELLDSRTKDLRAAEAFVTVADQYSHADLKTMVEQLNDEIFQCAAAMSDAVFEQQSSPPTFEDHESEAWAKVYEAASRDIADIWSQDMVSRLRAETAKGETILLEGLIQNTIVARCEEIAQSFVLDNTEVDNCMKQVWRHIKHSQQTKVAKNWLAMTHSKFKGQTVDGKGLLEHLWAIIITAGWRRVSGSERSTSTFEGAVEGRIADIMQRAVKLKEAMWEGIFSEHMEVATLPPGRAFNTLSMEDAYGDNQSSENAEGDSVVCTTGLGLCCKARKPISPDSNKTMWKADIILKPKVLLASTLSSPEPEPGKG